MDKEDKLREKWFRLVGEIEYEMASGLEDAWMDGLPSTFQDRFRFFRRKIDQLANVGNQLSLEVEERIENG